MKFSLLLYLCEKFFGCQYITLLQLYKFFILHVKLGQFYIVPVCTILQVFLRVLAYQMQRHVIILHAVLGLFRGTVVIIGGQFFW